MSGISLDLSSALATTLQPLDTNGDGVVSAEELAAAGKPARSQDPTVQSENAATGPASQADNGIVAILMDQPEDRAAAGDDTMGIDDILNEVSAIISAYREAADTASGSEDGGDVSVSI